jgi:hypothetical protein
MNAITLPAHLRRRREKLFGEGRSVPLDRNAKARIMVLARALTRRTVRGKHYGVVSAKALAVLEALLWQFHNAATGRCFPSFETIADKAGCARSTVAEALKALERAGLLSWHNRIARVRERATDLLGASWRWRIVRTSNAYQFRDPQPGSAPVDPSKSEIQTGTTNQELFNTRNLTAQAPTLVEIALANFRKARRTAPQEASRGSEAETIIQALLGHGSAV